MNEPKLFMKFEANTIQHLGVKMYSTMPPALAELIANAVKSFPGTFTTHMEERISLIEKADEEVISGWEDLDEMFFENETEEDVVSLIVEYIKANEGQFGQ